MNVYACSQGLFGPDEGVETVGDFQLGDVRLSDLDIRTHNKQAVNTTEVFCKAAGLEVIFSGNDYGNIDFGDKDD